MNHGSGVSGFGPWGSRTESCIGRTSIIPRWRPRLQLRNDLIAPRRSLVEKVFGTLKRSYGYSRVRYRGLQRNTVEMYLKLMAYNLRKYIRLTPHAA